MELDRVVPYLGALACLTLVMVLSAPFLLIEGQGQLVSDYYASGPLGVAGAIFLAALGIVIFLSSVRGRADASLVSGIMLAVGLTVFAITGLWAITIESTVLFSFPAEYSWLEYHPWGSLAVSALVAVMAAAYAVVVN